MIDTLAGAKVREARPPAIGFLVKGMFWAPRNEAAILYPLPIPIDTFKNTLKVLASRQISDDLKELLQFLQIPDDARNEATLQLCNFPNAKNGCKVELLPEEVALVLEDAQFEIVPPWIPFLIIPMSTFKEHETKFNRLLPGCEGNVTTSMSRTGRGSVTCAHPPRNLIAL